MNTDHNTSSLHSTMVHTFKNLFSSKDRKGSYTVLACRVELVVLPNPHFNLPPPPPPLASLTFPRRGHRKGMGEIEVGGLDYSSINQTNTQSIKQSIKSINQPSMHLSVALSPPLSLPLTNLPDDLNKLLNTGGGPRR